MNRKLISFAILIGACSSAADETLSPDGGASADAGSDRVSIPDANLGDESEPIDAGDVDASVVHLTGTAYHHFLDSRLAGATILIENAAGSVSVVTASDGTFDIPNVRVPYDLTMTSTEKGIPVTDRFGGLTTATPTIESGRADPQTAHSTTISGTVSGIADPIPAGTALRVYARNTGGGVAIVTRTAGQSPTFTITRFWFGPATKDFTLHAISFEQTGNAYPTSFSGYGEASVSATDGQPTSNANVTMTAPPVATVNGTITPADFNGVVGGVFFVNGPRETSFEACGFDGPASSPFSFPFPVIPGATFAASWYSPFDGGATGGEARFGALDASYDFAVAPPPVLVAPADATAFTSGMQFSWSGTANAIYRFALHKKSGLPGPAFYVMSTGTSITIPTAFTPEASSTYVWDLRELRGVTTIDTTVGPRGESFWGRVGTSRTLTVP